MKNEALIRASLVLLFCFGLLQFPYFQSHTRMAQLCRVVLSTLSQEREAVDLVCLTF
jgi:hypothetical protein